MIVLEMQTVIFTNVIVNLVGMIVMYILWSQNHNKYSGLSYWLFDWVLLIGGAVLITLQGNIPAWESMVLSNSMIVGGTFILYFGLCRFAGKKINPLLIYAVLFTFVLFVLVHIYFVYVRDDLLARSMNATIGLMIGCLMGSWLMFRDVSPQIRRISKGTGAAFAVIFVVSFIRVIGFTVVRQTSNQFLQSGKFDTLFVTLLVGAIAFLVFNLVLMVTRRLYLEAEDTRGSLNRSNMEFRATFETTTIGFGILVNRVLQEANDAFCKLSGYSREEIIGKSSRIFYPTDEEYQQIGHTYRKIEQFGTETTEIHLRRKDGEIINAILNVSAFDKNDLSKGVVFSVLDITERKRAEERSRYLASFPELNPNPVLEADNGGNLKYQNPATKNAFPTLAAMGLNHHFLSGWTQIIADLQAAKWSGTITREIKVGDDFYEQVISPEEGKLIRIYAKKITERKQAEQTLQSLTARLSELLSAIPDIVMEVDTNKLYTWANQAGFNFFGDDVIGKQADFYFEGKQDTYDLVKPLFNGDEGTFYVESWQRRKDGQKRMLAWWCRPLKDSSGNVRGALSSATDITDRKQLEIEKEIFTKELTEKNTELERFTYTVSHDLKSPLVTVKTFLGYLEQDMTGADTERIKKDMLFMSGATDKMEKLLVELLEMSRVGRIVNPPTVATFGDLAQESLKIVAGAIEERGVKIQLSKESIDLFGDRSRLVEIWQNLVENSVKFMGDQPSPEINIGIEHQGSETVFFVCDNGIGIDPRYQSKLFNLFEKINPRTEGTGMGLAITKRIVELYQGRIWVESEGLGHGSCFRFTLPGALKEKENGR